jgi:gamma-glutamyltranspeptidase
MEATFPDVLAAALVARGWVFRNVDSEDSGLHGFRVTPNGLQTGVDPRREGAAETAH